MTDSGYPAPGYEIRVIDPAAGAAPPEGAPGEILVRSPMLMQGDYGKPAETAEAIDAEGFMHTGDMGVWRPDGHLRFMGRYKDMLKIGGENGKIQKVRLRETARARFLAGGAPGRGGLKGNRGPVARLGGSLGWERGVSRPG